MPRIINETFGPQSDKRWLGSDRGRNTARSGILDVSTFTKATDYPQGTIPSGWPLGVRADGVLVKYNAEGTDGSENFAGHLLTDQRVVSADERLNVPVMDEGRILYSFLPVAFTPPASQPNTHFVYLSR